MTVGDRLMFHFVLTGDGGEVEWTLTDSVGQLVLSLKAADESVSRNVILDAGAYTMLFRRSSGTGPVDYRLSGDVIEDPIGPRRGDSTDSPSGGVGSGSDDEPYYFTGDDRQSNPRGHYGVEPTTTV